MEDGNGNYEGLCCGNIEVANECSPEAQHVGCPQHDLQVMWSANHDCIHCQNGN